MARGCGTLFCRSHSTIMSWKMIHTYIICVMVIVSPLPHQVLNDYKLKLQNDKTPLYIFLYNLLFNGKKNTFFMLRFMNSFTKQDQGK